MQPRFRELFALLKQHEVRYIVIGGAAMVLQGASYVTEDVDVLYERSDENLARLAEAIVTMKPRLRVEGEPAGLAITMDATVLRNGKNFTLTTAYGDFDLFGEIPGIGTYKDAVTNADEFDLPDAGITKVLSADQLVAAKRATGRPKDLAAIPELEAIADLRSREGDG